MVSPFRKKKQYPRYINVGSNDPWLIFKHILIGIVFRLSTNSSNIDIFTQNKYEYDVVLKKRQR